MSEKLITFQIPIGLTDTSFVKEQQAGRTVARPLDEDDAPVGSLYCGQRRSRTLPVAAARFANQLSVTLQERYG